jgi:hypothetical protein
MGVSRLVAGALAGGACGAARSEAGPGNEADPSARKGNSPRSLTRAASRA